MRNHHFLTVPAILLAIGTLLWACTKDRVLGPPEPDSYSGISIISSVQGYYHYPEGPDTDLVLFTVTGSDYTMEFQTDKCGLCDMSGTVKAFGTVSMTLTPTGPLNSNCDYRRVPKGEIPTVFRNDSLLIGPVTIGYQITANNLVMYDTSVFEFRLKAK